MVYFLVRYGDDCNPVELLTAQQLTDVYRKAEEFDGFSGISLRVKLSEQDIRALYDAITRLEWKEQPQKAAT